MKRGELKVKIFADGADANSIFQFSKLPDVKGFTTNPSLMRQAGVTNYKKFAKEILGIVKSLPVSLEVFADDMDGMYEQAKIISKLAKNVFVKIPIVNSKGESTKEVIASLGKEGIPLNLTAIMNANQVDGLLSYIDADFRIILSVFAGRIADTGCDPCPIVKSTVNMVRNFKKIEVLWASTREVYNVVQAENVGCHIITMPYAFIKKLQLFGKDLNEYSRETAETFFLDARSSGYEI
ncbi:MAG: transaldolase [Proteobacteria bacterium]|jgi:transaldolase|nr:transaldolase [Pseudomonadota bacterium]